MFWQISKPIQKQILMFFMGALHGTGAGGTLGFSSVFIPQMRKDPFFQLDSSQESWLASAPTILLFPTSLTTAYLLEKHGRKSIALGITIMELILWIFVYFCPNYTVLLSIRLIDGIQMGILYPTTTTYIGEISLPKYRTMTVTSAVFGSTCGAFLCQYLGEYIEWRTIALIFLIFPLTNIFLITYLKESYVTYLDRNDFTTASQAFEWYRGDTIEAKQEYDEIISDKMKQNRNSFWEVIRMCTKKNFLIPFGITTLVFLTNEATAVQAVIFYTSTIMNMINDDPEFTFYATLALNILRVVSVILSAFLVKRSTVRFILISTGYCLGVSLLLLALSMYLSETYTDNTWFPILSLIALVLNTILYNLGLGPLPTAVCAEMFPESTRSIGTSVSVSLSFLFLFIVVKFMPELISSIGSYWTFSIFGFCTLIGITLSNFAVPNTRNKTLQEINRVYCNEKVIGK